MKIFYSPKCLEYSQPGHPESPSRTRFTYELLKKNGYKIIEPEPCTEEDILLAHSKGLLESVKSGNFFDFDTPSYPGIFEIASLSAGAAIDAARHCLDQGEKAFSLMRPPGHHASKSQLGGFCYFNNIAIACFKARALVAKIAIVDFDCHHGNGTEDIVFGDDHFLYLSLHQSPLYPGTGLKSRKNCINYPLSPDTSPEQYLALLARGLNSIKTFDPDLLAVSAGFDSYRLDPITNLNLEQKTYFEIGKMLSEMNKPAFAILEGGYSEDLPECVHQFLVGLES